MSRYQLGKRSNERLVGVHPDLAKVVRRAIELSNQDFMVLEGVRTEQRQRELYGQGRTAKELSAVRLDPALARPRMAKVTWKLNSNHFKQADGFGHAVDLVPYPVDWNSFEKFDAIASAMFVAAAEEGVALRWGADWDRDGKRRERGETDSPHFELWRKD